MDPHVLSEVSRCELFQGFHEQEVEELLSKVPFRLRTFEKGRIIQLRGEPYESLQIILTGEVAAVMQSEGGSRFIPGFLGLQRVIAPGLLFARANVLPVTLLAKTRTSLLSIPKAAVFNLCRESEKFHLAFLQAIGERLRSLAGRLWEVEFCTLTQRLAACLLGLRETQHSDRIRLPWTRTELAETLGVARPSLARVFSSLHRQGLIESMGRVVRIKNARGLSSLLPRL